MKKSNVLLVTSVFIFFSVGMSLSSFSLRNNSEASFSERVENEADIHLVEKQNIPEHEAKKPFLRESKLEPIEENMTQKLIDKFNIDENSDFHRILQDIDGESFEPIASLTDAQVRSLYREEALLLWSAKNSYEALMWSLQSSFGVEGRGRNLIPELFANYAEENMSEAEDMLYSIDEADRYAVVDYLTRTKDHTDIVSALKWANNFNDPDFRAIAISASALNVVTTAPEMSIELLSNLELEGGNGVNEFSNIAEQAGFFLSEYRSKSIVDGDLSLYSEQIQPAIVDGVMENMASKSLQSTVEWVDKISEKKLKDYAIQNYISDYSTDLNQSIKLSASLSDNRKKVVAFTKIISQWYASGQELPRASIADAVTGNLDEKNRNILLELINL